MPRPSPDLSITLQMPPAVGYRDVFFSVPLFAAVKNGGEAAAAEVTFEGGELLVPCKAGGALPAGGSATFSAVALSPAYLAENDVLHSLTVRATVRAGGREASTEQSVTVLPFDWWEGTAGNAAYLACYIRPGEARCRALCEGTKKRLSAWERGADPSQAASQDAAQDDPRLFLAALFEEIRAKNMLKRETPSLSAPLSVRESDAFGVALLACACLERAGLRPILALGKERGVGVGVWRRESCLLSAATDDGETVMQYRKAGDLSFFDADDLLPARDVGFALSERRFCGDAFDWFVDIFRCRAEGISPCPVRKKTGMGYEIVRAEEYDGSAPPALPMREGSIPGHRQTEWESALFDFGARNPLLAFGGKRALRLASSSFGALAGLNGEYKLFRAEGRAREELLRLEESNGLLRVISGEEEMKETCAYLYRRAHEAEEAGGADLYLALGTLRYPAKEGERTAPIALLPVRLLRRREEYFLSRTGNAAYANDTLFELLKREYGIEIERAGEPSRLIARVRAAIAGRHGFDVAEENFLGVFFFQRYFLWRDLHDHADLFERNALYKSLFYKTPFEAPPPQEAGEILLPLAADSAQEKAVRRAAAGESFVLHGPPGTGKSQTIANMIANLLYRGKRVLFVAEKRAALDVVKARLTQAGAGEFCLELHSDKTDKASVLRRMSNTLALSKEAGEMPDFSETAALTASLASSFRALHEQSPAGFSVYDAVEGYFARQNVPDVARLDAAFFEGLTAETLATYRRDILSAAAAAKECGGVYRSPFAGMETENCDPARADAIRCAAEVAVASGAHLRRMLGMVCEAFSQRVFRPSPETLSSLLEICRGLASGAYEPYFGGEDMYAENRALDLRLVAYRACLRSPVRLNAPEEILAFLEGGGDWKLSAAVASAVKKLKRKSFAPLSDEEAARLLRIAAEVQLSLRRLKEHPRSARLFCRFGRVAMRKRDRALTPLYELYRRAEAVFPDFQAEGFRMGCARAEALSPLFEGLIRAEQDMREAAGRLCEAACMQASGDLFEVAERAGALLEHLDLLPNWCMYRSKRKKLAAAGLTFLTDALEEGKLDGENILSSFEKCMYRTFLERKIPNTPALAAMTPGTLGEIAEKLRNATERLQTSSRNAVRAALCSRLGGGEVAAFSRFEQSDLRGVGLRAFFGEIPTLFRILCPCLLMTPAAVAQYLPPAVDDFDCVIFDEASQLPTAEAAGALARGKAAVVVGDPKQLPPTSFFNAPCEAGSLLDDCLASGLKEEKLLWHYRSRHESLIAFSNEMYYGGKLFTAPSPDEESRVRLVPVQGTYDRARTKRNETEAAALVCEVVRRLGDPVLSKQSMGIVTFSEAQRSVVEAKLLRAVSAAGLEGAAFGREEPLFVKNLENVQGDERDVILFSVGYGRDAGGKLSLNFGPLNQAGGWRRLNVAVSRAREEMLVFSSLRAEDIDVRRTASQGVAGLKAFLAFAARGGGSRLLKDEGNSVGKCLAEGLARGGYSCQRNVGTSAFRIDVAVEDPRKQGKFLLAVLGDGGAFSVRDRFILRRNMLESRGWAVAETGSVRFFSNPEREIRRIKEILDRLTGKSQDGVLKKYKRSYRFFRANTQETPEFFESGNFDDAIKTRLRAIVEAEEPIGRAFLKRRCLQSYGVEGNRRIEGRLDALIDSCAFRRDRAMGGEYFYRTARALAPERFRVEAGVPVRRVEDLTVYEMLALVKGALEERVFLYLDELVPLAAHALKEGATDRFSQFVEQCVSYGEEKGLFVRSASDRVTLA